LTAFRRQQIGGVTFAPPKAALSGSQTKAPGFASGQSLWSLSHAVRRSVIFRRVSEGLGADTPEIAWGHSRQTANLLTPVSDLRLPNNID